MTCKVRLTRGAEAVLDRLFDFLVERPFGRSGCVALFEIEDGSTVAVVAVRHQLEDDYH